MKRLLDVLAFGVAELASLEVYCAYWKDEGADGLLRRVDKIAAEAILLAYLASRVPQGGRPLANAVEALCDRAEGYIACGRNEALLRRFPQTVTTLGASFVLLSKLGRKRPAIDRLLRRALERGFLTLAERSTFRLMDGRWAYRLFDQGLVRPVEELLPLSTLAASPHPIYTMSEDEYALTHALFYLTDFGQILPSPAIQQGGDRFIDPFLAWNAIRGNLDLLGEFLISALVLREQPSPTFRFAWRLFFQIWDSQGLVGPDYSSARFAQLSRVEAAAYAFSENYHTKFVGGILCAVALSALGPEIPAQERNSPALGHLAMRCSMAASHARCKLNVAAPRRDPLDVPAEELPEWICSRLIAVLGMLPDPPPPWLRAAIDCDLSRQELTCVLYDGLLVAAARNYYLVQLAEALAVGARHESLHSLSFIRALEFLLDQQLESGFVGIHGLLAAEQNAAPLDQAQEVLAGLLEDVGTVLQH